jgi:hypothetical protein
MVRSARGCEARDSHAGRGAEGVAGVDLLADLRCWWWRPQPRAAMAHATPLVEPVNEMLAEAQSWPEAVGVQTAHAAVDAFDRARDHETPGTPKAPQRRGPPGMDDAGLEPATSALSRRKHVAKT